MEISVGNFPTSPDPVHGTATLGEAFKVGKWIVASHILQEEVQPSHILLQPVQMTLDFSGRFVHSEQEAPLVSVPEGVDEDNLRNVPRDGRPLNGRDLVETMRGGDRDDREARGDAHKPRSLALTGLQPGALAGPVTELDLAPGREHYS